MDNDSAQAMAMDENNWIFPSITLFDKSKQKVEALAAEVEALKADNNRLKSEIDQTHQDYKAKIEVVNQLIAAFEQGIVLEDQETIEMLQAIITKAVRKIIQKEIKLNTDVIQIMLEELKNLIKENDGLIQIQLSPADYDQLFDDGISDNTVMKKCDNLAVGDVLIQSKKMAIDARLEDRIKLILGI